MVVTLNLQPKSRTKVFERVHVCVVIHTCAHSRTYSMWCAYLRIRIVYVYVCICCVCMSIRTSVLAHLCVSRFAIAMYSPPLVFPSLFAMFSFHVLPTIQFIRWIILGNVENRGLVFQPSLFFYLVIAPVEPPRTPFSMCLHRLLLNHNGWIEGAYLGSIPRLDRVGFAQTWPIVTFFFPSPD